VRYLLILLAIVLLSACSSNTSKDNFKEVKVKEVVQVQKYTYLYVKGKGPAHWIAVPTMEASEGETYYYQGGLPMEEFYSEELNRTFEKVLFVDALSKDPMDQSQADSEFSYDHMVTVEKSNADIAPEEGSITIEALYADAEKYSGKVVRVKGEVTKFNSQIMNRNWVHIQDGTEHEGSFDLTATSDESFETGSTVILEGTLALNKDFGYGYSYQLLLENAVSIQPGTNK
jgi:hypothetical protein